MEQLHSTDRDYETEDVDPVDIERGLDALELHANQVALGKRATQITAFEYFAKGIEQLEPDSAKHRPKPDPKPPTPPPPVTKRYKTGPLLHQDV